MTRIEMTQEAEDQRWYDEAVNCHQINEYTLKKWYYEMKEKYARDTKE